MIRTHQPILDRDLARDQVDQAAVNEVGRDPAWPFGRKDQRLALDPGQPADPRTDRASGAQAHCLGHIRQPGVLDRLSGGVDAINDERIDLTLDLVINPQIGIEAVFVVGRLHLAGDPALLVAGIEPRDRPRARLAGDEIGPDSLNFGSQRSDKAKTGYDDTTHGIAPKNLCGPDKRMTRKRNGSRNRVMTGNGNRPNPFGLSLSKPA